jgi:hypothetical protein
VPHREVLIVKGFVMYWKYLNIHYEIQPFNQVFLKGQIISSQVIPELARRKLNDLDRFGSKVLAMSGRNPKDRLPENEMW